jgi:hypothetical protein
MAAKRSFNFDDPPSRSTQSHALNAEVDQAGSLPDFGAVSFPIWVSGCGQWWECVELKRSRSTEQRWWLRNQYAYVTKVRCNFDFSYYVRAIFLRENQERGSWNRKI